MDKIIGAGIVLLVAVALCCGGSTLAKVGYDTFYSNPTATPTPDPTVEKLREELDKDPEKLAERLASADAVDAIDLDMGEVPGKGRRSIIMVDGNITNCEEPGKDVPTRCIRLEGTPYWLCNGQILIDCPHCPIPTPATAVPPTGVPPTATATAIPPTGVPPTATTTPIVPPTATAIPPTGVPPTNTWTPPTSQPTPYGTATCESTPTSRPCEDQNVDFWAEPVLDPDDFGTRLKVAGNGHHVRLSDTVNWQKVQEEVRMCQLHVVSAHSIHDLIGGRTLTGCVIAYRQGLPGDDSYHQVRYEAIDGYGYHINTPQAGFGLQEGGTQVKKALLTARKADGSYACRIPGDASRPGAQDIQLMELGLEGR